MRNACRSAESKGEEKTTPPPHKKEEPYHTSTTSQVRVGGSSGRCDVSCLPRPLRYQTVDATGDTGHLQELLGKAIGEELIQTDALQNFAAVTHHTTE